MAVNMDVAIIQVSQVNRDYSKTQVMDLYAGKGSGAIENASRKVLGITGKADSTAKSVEMYKNSDGDLFNVKLEWTPSFRLKRKKPEVIHSKVMNKKFTILEDEWQPQKK